MIKKNVGLTAVTILCWLGLNGCTAALVFQGVSGGAPVAFHSAGGGKGDSAWLAHYDDVVQATLRAGEALSLKLEKKEIGINQSVFLFKDDKEKGLEILIERRTATMTHARFNVGLFGSTSMGRLMARQIVFEMTEADAFLQDWKPAKVE